MRHQIESQKQIDTHMIDLTIYIEFLLNEYTELVATLKMVFVFMCSLLIFGDCLYSNAIKTIIEGEEESIKKFDEPQRD